MADFPLDPVPPEQAIKFFRSKGYEIGFDWRDVETEAHARAFTVAKGMQLDILQDIRGALDGALANGTTFDQFRQELAPKLKAKGWWGKTDLVDPLTGELRPVQLGSNRRLRLIFDANMSASYAAGRWVDIQRNKANRPYLRYVAILDEKTRPEHRKWHGLIRPVDDPIWRVLYPPNGWHCRCFVQQLSQRDLDRNGWAVSDKPDLKTKPWTNKRTGEVIDVPDGIDPGWHQNVGHNYSRHLEQQLAEKIEALPEAAGGTAIQSIVSGTEFKDLLKYRYGGSLPVGILDGGLADEIKSIAKVVKVSDQTVAKQTARHPDVQAEDYLIVDEVIRRGEAMRDGADNLVFQAEVSGKLWRAVVKSTKDRRELFLTTFHRISEAHRQRARKRTKQLREEN